MPPLSTGTWCGSICVSLMFESSCAYFPRKCIIVLTNSKVRPITATAFGPVVPRVHEELEANPRMQLRPTHYSIGISAAGPRLEKRGRSRRSRSKSRRSGRK